MMKRRHSHLRTCSLAHTCVSARGEATCRERERLGREDSVHARTGKGSAGVTHPGPCVDELLSVLHLGQSRLDQQSKHLLPPESQQALQPSLPSSLSCYISISWFFWRGAYFLSSGLFHSTNSFSLHNGIVPIHPPTIIYWYTCAIHAHSIFSEVCINTHAPLAKIYTTLHVSIPAEQFLAERVSQRWQPAGQPLGESLSHLSLFLPPSPAINTVFMSPQLHYHCKTLPCPALPILVILTTPLLAAATFCPHKAQSRCLRRLVCT